MTAPIKNKHTIGEFMTQKGFELLKDLHSAVTFGTLKEWTERIYAEDKKLLCSMKEFLSHDASHSNQNDDILRFIESIEIKKIDDDMGFRNTDYKDLPMVWTKDGYRRVYMTGQSTSVHIENRTKLLVENDYVLTNDQGKCIYTDEVLTRELLMSLSQKDIQGEGWTLGIGYVYLPIPREEAKHQKQKFIKDRNNIAQKGGR